MYRRRLMILFVLALASALGIVLALALRPSQLLRIAAPVVPATVKDLGSAVAVSATTLLEKPRYTGQDAAGRSWLLTAESAGQEGTATSGTYVLNAVEATFSSPSQTVPFSLSAETGRYRQASSTILLSGDVSATGLGFNLAAPQVEADFNTRTLRARGGSRVTGNTGGWGVDITAPTLSADQNSSRMVLTGGVHAIFTPTKAR